MADIEARWGKEPMRSSAPTRERPAGFFPQLGIGVSPEACRHLSDAEFTEYLDAWWVDARAGILADWRTMRQLEEIPSEGLPPREEEENR